MAKNTDVVKQLCFYKKNIFVKYNNFITKFETFSAQCKKVPGDVRVKVTKK